jgi:PelA/Pel-15E family pectate lyase
VSYIVMSETIVNQKECIKSILSLIFGILLIALFIATIFLIEPPFDNLIPVAIGLWSIIGSFTIPTGLVLILPNLPKFQDRVSQKAKILLYTLLFMGGFIITWFSLPQVVSIDFDFWIIRDNGPLFAFAMNIVWISLATYQILFGNYYLISLIKLNRQNTPNDVKSNDIESNDVKLDDKNMRRKLKVLSIPRVQSLGLLCLLLVGSSGFLYYLSTATLGDFEGCVGLSDPYYDPVTGAHYNPKLDTLPAIDEPLLEALEKAVRSFTQLRQPCGGWPMYCTSDYCQFVGDGPSLYPNEIDFQLGTPQAGELYLIIYQLEPNPIYLQLANGAGDATVKSQDQFDGGWCKYGLFDAQNNSIQPNFRNYRHHASYDDNTMQGTMQFLLKLYNETTDVKYLNSLNTGFDHLERHQYERGSWPQETNYIYPYYHIYSTLNDGLMEDMFDMYLLAINVFPERKTEFRAIIDKAFDWLELVQGNGGTGDQIGGWAQQYDFDDQPCWARAFEPPALESSGTAGLVNKFIELYCFFNDTKYLDPIPAAITWLNNSKVNYTEDEVEIEGWSRLYELETNTPIFGLADGGPKEEPQYSYVPVRDGYSWYGTWGNSAIDNWEHLVDMEYNITEYMAWKYPAHSLSGLRSNAEANAGTLNTEGFWLDDGERIHVKEFYNNALDMIEYFEKLVEIL